MNITIKVRYIQARYYKGIYLDELEIPEKCKYLKINLAILPGSLYNYG
jgi:hypothetical protein